MSLDDLVKEIRVEKKLEVREQLVEKLKLGAWAWKLKQQRLGNICPPKPQGCVCRSASFSTRDESEPSSAKPWGQLA